MSATQKVDDFLSKLDHPMKAEMEAVRDIIVKANPKIEEDVKWGGPSFAYKEEMATLNPRVKDYVPVIFHKGSLFDDDSGLLEAGPKGRAYAKFRSMDDIEANRATLEKLVNDWVKMMDE
ncbi:MULTISPECIES: DUF1801 domain-containing protein [Planobispora]|uniref:YdhG-like domain-containing protein n=2 Tax=Planobispora TaxID=29298 RepID=A0A8J3T3P1_9ACTN|nr:MULTISPECIES: DUF1801 domain-containing protein [Planobispora]GIH97698.1 hypothetical protein Psi01_83280 [Planobispora siamensis]GII04692.1 hypothetical protein Pta02_67000 [Planobispora takensis]